MARKERNNSGSSGEKQLTCRKCGEKFKAKKGSKNNGCSVTVQCPYCRTDNVFKQV